MALLNYNCRRTTNSCWSATCQYIQLSYHGIVSITAQQDGVKQQLESNYDYITVPDNLHPVVWFLLYVPGYKFGTYPDGGLLRAQIVFFMQTAVTQPLTPQHQYA